MADILIIGGGVIGLATAVELALHGAKVKVLERGICAQAATWAAAGMLAPEAEQLDGELLELGLRSRALYPEWVSKLNHITGEDCGYRQCGIFAPMIGMSEWESHSKYIDRQQANSIQTGLSHDIAGGLWFPEDGQVDNRRLARVLLLAARSIGVEILEGVTVSQIAHSAGKVTHLATSHGDLKSDRYLLATGAWSKELMSLPVTPRKGQMLAVFDPNHSLERVLFAPNVYIVPRQDGSIIIGATVELERVLFAPNVYIVPRQDGSIIIGATVEDVGFTDGNTTAEIDRLLTEAISIYPSIANMSIQSTWWGFRPYAPNEMPIIGMSDYANLFLATGHYRNGILLAPITAHLIANSMGLESSGKNGDLQHFARLFSTVTAVGKIVP